MWIYWNCDDNEEWVKEYVFSLNIYLMIISKWLNGWIGLETLHGGSITKRGLR